MITRQQVEALLQYQPGPTLVTSCYLNLDRARTPVQALKIRIKDLLQSAQRQLEGKAATHEQRESLRADFQRIEEFVMQELAANHHKGLAVFASRGQKFWQTYRLPRLGRNILVVDPAPYIRPLMATLAEYHRYGVVLLDRTHGRLFEMYMGKIVEHNEVTDAVPRRVNEGGFQGRDERSIERRHAQAVQHHLQNVADAAVKLFQRDHCDRLVLGGHHELLTEFKALLPAALKPQMVGEFSVDAAKFTVPEVLRQTLAIEHRVELEHEHRLTNDLIRQAEAGNRAVKGLTRTLAALSRGEAQLLLVEEGFELPGFVCTACRQASVEPQPCPQCGQPAAPCNDIVDEAINLALLKNCQIKHIRGVTPLREAGRIGALLRYQA